MKILELLADVVNQLTDGFSKSQSVNYLYKLCKKIVEIKLKDMEVYDFSSLSNWLNQIKSTIYKNKYKCIKRIIYSLNLVISNNNVLDSKVRFVYEDDNSQFRKLSINSKQVVTNYLNKFVQYNNSFITFVRNYISYYLLFLEKKNINYKFVTYEDIFRFKTHIENLNLKYQTVCKIFNLTAKFIVDVSDDVRRKIGSIILKTTRSNYISEIVRIDKATLESIDFESKNADLTKAYLFFEALKSSGYSKKSIINAKRIISEFLFFSFYFNVPLTSNNALIWSKYVYINIVKEFDYRSLAIKFVDFLNTGKIINTNSFFNSSNNDPHENHKNFYDIPLWSKHWAEKYISYRISLNYKPSTINMDRNAIYRFITYLTSININSFNEIKAEHVFSFISNDNHYTAEGRNAYTSRVKIFLLYLKDNNQINFYIDSGIFGKYRIDKKLIKVIDNEDINKITNYNYSNPIELRSYAIFILSVKCGLRSIDVVNLKFNDVSFKDKIIKINQIKTQKEIKIPVSNIVLNAIYNYVKNGRPKSSSEYIFLSHKIPFGKLDRSICDKSFKILRILNNIETNKYNGFHICRKTFASNVINKTQSVNLTAFSLGHSDNSTVDDYVSIETKSMHECAMSLDNITYRGFENESL